MADAGSGSTSQPSLSSAPSTSIPPSPRPTRIHFPGDTVSTSHAAHNGIHSLGIGPPPPLRKSNNLGGSSQQQDDKRRRVKSVDAPAPFDQRRARDAYPSSQSRRAMSFSRRAENWDAASKSGTNVLAETFSDEFDLGE